MMESPLSHRMSWGLVEYDHELTKDEIYNFELFVDMIDNHTHTPIWYTSCHWCNRGTSIAGKIGNDGLCGFCRKNKRIADI